MIGVIKEIILKEISDNVTGCLPPLNEDLVFGLTEFRLKLWLDGIEKRFWLDKA